ncbi:MAG: OsmC family protein [Paenibacillus macerans]|uniref:OsmC-like family protein n=2 Tax=Paenibacillus macerans TaxID=44252 RepID=A0A091A7N6_PAEMA|nr:OsmC family protein [Paenibacillus macerans]KFN12251.1 osmC-like family protein [Paenibacillus macerans]MCY7558727.1 OsmC family protein [Paenibacillus macerans]MDU7475997.1 OsmC family protein [Paenibacillus macerans]MEC0140563.1 OsmC family protein [Paenibacillus macerans]MEC0153065.1 OsmC family protein [Paenibacillus macerans]
MITVAWDGSIYRTTSNYAYKPPEGAEFSPMDIMCEALGMCIAVSLVRLLEQDEITGEALRVEVEPFKAQAGSPRVEKFRVQVELPFYLEEPYKERLLTQASRICTIGNTIKRGAEIEYEIKA